MDDDTVFADRSDRALIDVLYGLPKQSVKMVSPRSTRLKIWVKLPMILYVTTAAMVSSLSELFVKIVGAIIIDAEEFTDLFWLLVFVPMLVTTATVTMIYVNYGIKYYDQIEVMPIYQTSLLLHNILVGLLCLNEIKFYTFGMLGGIGISTFICSIGIFVLLEKNKDKGPAIHESLNQTDQEETIEMGQVATKEHATQFGIINS